MASVLTSQELARTNKMIDDEFGQLLKTDSDEIIKFPKLHEEIIRVIIKTQEMNEMLEILIELWKDSQNLREKYQIYEKYNKLSAEEQSKLSEEQDKLNEEQERLVNEILEKCQNLKKDEVEDIKKRLIDAQNTIIEKVPYMHPKSDATTSRITIVFKEDEKKNINRAGQITVNKPYSTRFKGINDSNEFENP